MFRNLRLYRIHGPWPESEQALDEALGQKPFRPCSSVSERSAGWESPAARDGDEPTTGLARRLAGADLLQLRTQNRVLPPAAVKESLVERVDEYRRRMGQEPPPRELRRLKEETRNELLPKSLVQSTRTRGFALPRERLFAVDAAAPARAEWFMEHLRTCLDGVRLEPLRFVKSPGTLLQEMFLGTVPSGFSLGMECRMADPSDGRASGTWRHVDLDDETLRRHVRDGMKLTHLGFSFEEAFSGVLGEDGVISKVRLPEGDAADVSDAEDDIARLDAEFVLLTGMARRLVDRLETLLDGFDDRARAVGVGAPGSD